MGSDAEAAAASTDRRVDAVRRAAGVAIGPILLATGLVVADYASYGGPVAGVMRSVAVAVAVAFAGSVMALVITRRWTLGAIAANVFVLVAWDLATGIFVPLIVTRTAFTAWYALHVHGRQKTVTLEGVAAAVPPFGVALILVGVASLWSVGGFRYIVAPGPAGTPAAGPSIYIVLRDSYPRADVLAEIGFDNEPFLAALEARGFDVARQSTSNYTNTQHTMASMLYMAHLPDIDRLRNPPPDSKSRLRMLGDAIADGGPAVSFLRDRGYWVATVGSNINDATIWTAAQLACGRISDYEIHLVSETTVGRASVALDRNLVADQHRANLRGAFESLVENQGPGRFIWTHVLSPHGPIVFGPDGQELPMEACFPDCTIFEFFGMAPARQAAFVGQIRYLNELTLECRRSA